MSFKTFLDRFRRQVPDRRVQIIYWRGRYSRINNRPFAWRWPWFESFGDQLVNGIKVVDRSYKNISSCDGVLHNATVHVKVMFDMRKVAPHLASVLAEHGEAVIHHRVTGIVERILRKMLRDIKASKLWQPGIISQIEQELGKTITKELGGFGVSLMSSVDGLYVKEILAPERLQASRTESTSLTETTQSLNQLSPEEAGQALIAILLRDMGTQGMRFRSVNLPEVLNSASGDLIDGSYRVLRKPTGRVYAN